MAAIDDFVEYLNMRQKPTETAKLDELQRMLDAATQRVEAVCGPLTPVEVTERVDVTRGQGITRSWPVLELVSARIAPRPWEVLTTPTTAVLAGLSTSGELDCATAITGTVLIVVRAGRQPVPEVLREAVLVIASHLYDTQRTQGPATGPSGGGEAVVLTGFAVPRRAAELMKPFTAPRVG